MYLSRGRNEGSHDSQLRMSATVGSWVRSGTSAKEKGGNNERRGSVSFEVYLYLFLFRATKSTKKRKRNVELTKPTLILAQLLPLDLLNLNLPPAFHPSCSTFLLELSEFVVVSLEVDLGDEFVEFGEGVGCEGRRGEGVVEEERAFDYGRAR